MSIFPTSLLPAPHPAPEQQPPLEVVPDGYRSPRWVRRRARLVAAVGVVLACGMLFGLAGVHVLLTEGQFRLEHLQSQSDEAQAQYVRLRLEVAQLESPERIVATAQERLGMVPPTALTYLTPTGAVAAPPPPAPSHHTRPVASPTQDWSAAKPALSSHP